jgi:hypothetical protein
MKIGKKNKRQRSRDGISYEILKRKVTPEQWEALEFAVQVHGVHGAAQLEMAGAGGRWNRKMKEHLYGALREINRKLREKEEQNALL